MSRKSKYDKEMDKNIKDLENYIHRVKKKEWISKGFKPPWEKNKRKKKNISDVNKGLKVVDKKLDRIIKDNISLKKEVKSLKQDIKTQKELKLQKLREEKPKSILELQREGGNIIDPEIYKQNVKLKEELTKKNKKENK